MSTTFASPTVTAREAATILHALRCFQELVTGGVTDGCLDGSRQGACEHFDDHEPLTPIEIDALCERFLF